eukprot:CAMPEP_0170567400 /NCGR_PEP_ID=MMETSP0211-20121228/80452_1 /TAXON_ID=311385 /ORGANISM="Pseudokeronopsis sp., Strain OXSARD2" /LENGTH=323 /DNA_ID=CAMNT_0010888839 /DNA_START=152 /DNA_END=1121 /DNA_ORIENTATION=-
MRSVGGSGLGLEAGSLEGVLLDGLFVIIRGVIVGRDQPIVGVFKPRGGGHFISFEEQDPFVAFDLFAGPVDKDGFDEGGAAEGEESHLFGDEVGVADVLEAVDGVVVVVVGVGGAEEDDEELQDVRPHQEDEVHGVLVDEELQLRLHQERRLPHNIQQQHQLEGQQHHRQTDDDVVPVGGRVEHPALQGLLHPELLPSKQHAQKDQREENGRHMVANHLRIDLVDGVFEDLFDDEGHPEGVDLGHEIAKALQGPTVLAHPSLQGQWQDIVVDLVVGETEVSYVAELDEIVESVHGLEGQDDEEEPPHVLLRMRVAPLEPQSED